MLTNPLQGFRDERGFLWPASDVNCAAVIFDMRNLEEVYRHCRGFDVVVQAGGNCGVWPLEMSKKFGTVYTFEPDPANFRCLCHNAPGHNIFKFNAALGYQRGCVDLYRYSYNVGAHYIEGAGDIPVLQIDDLALPRCDLIYLDIEGYELAALQGAVTTLHKFRPVIAVEEKGLSAKYQSQTVEQWLSEIGYRVAVRLKNIHHDVVFVSDKSP